MYRDRYSKAADSDPNYTQDCEEPLNGWAKTRRTVLRPHRGVLAGRQGQMPAQRTHSERIHYLGQYPATQPGGAAPRGARQRCCSDDGIIVQAVSLPGWSDQRPCGVHRV